MLALLGAVFGGLLRLAPEVLKMFTAKGDRDHEYRMTSLNIEGSVKLQGMKNEGAALEGQIAVDRSGLDALREGIKAQGQITGVAWVDALSQSVRPIVTYWWMTLYTVVKFATLIVMWGESSGWAQAFLIIWTEADMGILGGIINFWFLDRVITNKRKS